MWDKKGRLVRFVVVNSEISSDGYTTFYYTKGNKVLWGTMYAWVWYQQQLRFYGKLTHPMKQAKI